MKSVGIITIHNIFNYGSVFQAYALQRICEQLGCRTEIINYVFPNQFHSKNPNINENHTIKGEPFWIKALFFLALIRQHKGITHFVSSFLRLSSGVYNSPNELMQNPPHYDVYITGSDQLWNPRHCNGDPSFLLHFAPPKSLKISYAASFGTNEIPSSLQSQYKELLGQYKHISVRENSGATLIKELTGQNAKVVLDPTLLLNKDDWNCIARPKRLIREPYILCYFLNYSFNAFPYVDELALEMQRQTGFKLVRVARPPHGLQLKGIKNFVGASPQEFLALVRDAEIILTTSFHGTAFAVNFGKPFFTVVENRNAKDSRQMSLVINLGLDSQVLSLSDNFPEYIQSKYDVEKEQKSLDDFRRSSIQFLINALNDE